MTSRPRLDQNLRQARYNVKQMAIMVERSIDRAYRALRLHDEALAASVVNDDDGIDKRRYEIERQVTTTLALQLPRSHDQRVLVATLMIATELERMADHAAGIARTVLRTEERIDPDDYPSAISEMSQLVRHMVLDSATAFVEENADSAAHIADRDDQVDALYYQLFDDMVQHMRDGTLTIRRGTFFLWAGHSLERVGDRVTNICERVIYAATGDIVNLNRKIYPTHFDTP